MIMIDELSVCNCSVYYVLFDQHWWCFGFTNMLLCTLTVMNVYVLYLDEYKR